MWRSIPYIAVSILVLVMLFYLQNYRPELMAQMLLEVDVFGFSSVANEEHMRVSTINMLPLHYEEKQVLINHTVFLGATEEMVKLALGEPKKTPSKGLWKNEEGQEYESLFYVYYLPGAIRPTIMVFQPDKNDKNIYKLVSAFKSSALEWGN